MIKIDCGREYALCCFAVCKDQRISQRICWRFLFKLLAVYQWVPMLMLMLLFCMWIHSDDSDSFKTTKQIFDELEIENVTEQDCRLVRHVCSLVSRRAAFLASAGALKIVADAAVLGLGLGCHSSWLEKQRLCCGYCTEK